MQKPPTLASGPSLLPVLPELQLNLTQFDEEDDAEEEKNMMNILLKLKNAQNSMNESRKRKRSKQLAEDALQKYSNEAKELVVKHNRRWSTKFNHMTQKSKKLKQSGEDLLERIEANKKHCTDTVDKHQKAVNGVLDSLASLEKECSNVQFDNKENFDSDIARIRTQVHDRLREMKEVLVRTHSQATKDDRFTKIIKSFLVNF